MYKILAITNRKLVKEPFLEAIDKISKMNVEAIILREKDLSPTNYKDLAKKVKKICDTNNKDLVIHSHIEVAKELGIKRLHLPFNLFKDLLEKDQFDFFDNVSTSCHSIEEAMFAYKNGANRIIIGNIFETDCKKGLKGKGLTFIKDISSKIPIPIYAVGGIKACLMDEISKAGATGGAVISGLMIESERKEWIGKI